MLLLECSFSRTLGGLSPVSLEVIWIVAIHRRLEIEVDAISESAVIWRSSD